MKVVVRHKKEKKIHRVGKKKSTNSKITLPINQKNQKTEVKNIKQVLKKIKDDDCNECIDNMAHPLRKKMPLEKRFEIKLPLGELFDCVLFKMVNPTSLPCSFNLFAGFSLVPVPNTPNGYVPNLNPLGVPVMNFPASASAAYPSYECAIVHEPLSGALNYATVYVPTTDRVYIVDNNNVQVINPNTNIVVNTIALPTITNGGSQAVFNSVMNRVYISSFIGSTIDIIDCATETVFGSFSSSSGSPVLNMAFNVTNNTMYNAMGTDNNIEILNCATNTTGGLILLSGTVSGVTIWVSGANTYCLAINSFNNTFYYINAALNTIISSFVTVSNGTGFGGGNCIIYNSVNNSVYYIDFARTSIVEISMATFTVVGSISCNQPTSLLYISNYNVLYCDDFASGNQVKVFTCVSNTLLNTIPVSLTLGTIPNPLMGQLSYDSLNNSAWVTRNYGLFAEEQVSKLCANNPMCYIVGSQDYNEFIQDLRNNPICVRQMNFYYQNSPQVSVPLNLQTKDANGNMCTIPRLPNITLSTDQFQPNIATVDFHCKDLVLDCLTTINQYTIAPNSEVTFVMYYKQVQKVDLLTSKKTVCKTLDKSIKCSDGNSRSESDLKFNSPRPHKRPKWMKPFSSSMIKDGSGGTSSDSCNTCFEELGRPVFNATVNPVVIESPKVFVVKKKIDSADNCGTCFEEIGHPISKKLDKFYEKSVKDFDIVYNKIPLDDFSSKCCLKD